VSPFRPDLIEVWPFRILPGGGAAAAPRIEILLIQRSKTDRILPGLWQCVSGGLEPGERVTASALRELAEETGIGPDEIEAFFDLDQVNQFHEATADGILTSVIFAVRVRPDASPRVSHEHDAMKWVSPEEALDIAVWPAYRESIHRIADNLLDPRRSKWFELTLAGERVRP
jgi:8-oxo-dGTP pyrophosphatase MutT (NUDIX family)